MAVDLTLFGRLVETVFDLLGDKENDLTFSLGWGLSQSPTLVKALLSDVFSGEDVGHVQAVRLQEHVRGSGFTDIEVETLVDRPGFQHVVITGRDAPQALIDAADLVSEVNLVKHQMEQGIRGQQGIEW